MIKLEALTKKYRDFTAVDNLNLEVQEGEIFGIIGHNGAGKTTTLKMIVGLLAPTSGSINVMGWDMTKEPTRWRSRVSSRDDPARGIPRCGIR